MTGLGKMFGFGGKVKSRLSAQRFEFSFAGERGHLGGGCHCCCCVLCWCVCAPIHRAVCQRVCVPRSCMSQREAEAGHACVRGVAWCVVRAVVWRSPVPPANLQSPPFLCVRVFLPVCALAAGLFAQSIR